MKPLNRIAFDRRRGGYRAGDAYYIQDGCGPFGFRRPLGGVGPEPFFIRRTPWQIQAFTLGDIAILKCLRTGRIRQCAMWLIKIHEEANLTKP